MFYDILQILEEGMGDIDWIISVHHKYTWNTFSPKPKSEKMEETCIKFSDLVTSRLSGFCTRVVSN